MILLSHELTILKLMWNFESTQEIKVLIVGIFQRRTLLIFKVFYTNYNQRLMDGLIYIKMYYLVSLTSTPTQSILNQALFQKWNHIFVY